MSRKQQSSTRQRAKTKSSGRGTPYPSLAKAPPPAGRLAEFLKATATEQVEPLTEDELDQWLAKFPNLWPDDTEIDSFVHWLHRARGEGRYA